VQLTGVKLGPRLFGQENKPLCPVQIGISIDVELFEELVDRRFDGIEGFKGPTVDPAARPGKA